jgi:DNA-binding winged helix-turn-helix (wHTH) protein/tetratricopeptide (TPR) repeat protein
VLKFAGFELDRQRAELRGPDSESIRLRPKAFAMLHFLADNARRVVSKQELMEAVWPNIHVGEDSLFQCIREIRSALGNDHRHLLKVVSGRGYLFEVEVSYPQAESIPATEANERPVAAGPSIRRFPIGLRLPRAVAIGAGLCAIVTLVIVASLLAPNFIFKHEVPTVAVLPIVDTSDNPQAAELANGVTERLTDGLAEVDNIRVVVPRSSGAASNPSAQSDFVLQGELQKGPQSWTLQARLIKSATGQIQAVATVSIDLDEPDPQLQQSRLAAGAGDVLTRRLNAILEAGSDSAATGGAKTVVDQAMASINQTSRERFVASQTMVEKALAGEPDNIDLQVALAALQTRGIQMLWYDQPGRAAAESNARSLLEQALQTTPRYIPVLEAYCRFLSATNNFVESLVACAKVLNFAPWNGSALYQLGLTQIHLGRFQDALATFKQADRFDTPAVSRWTWLLGVGWANLLLGNNEEAVPWIERSIAITPASGRPYLLLAAAYQRLGRTDEAKAALAKALELRPGSTAANVRSPTRNVSPVFLETGQRLIRTLVEVGLPER